MPDSTHIPPDMDRLRWQCRRGMLELDEILLQYQEERFPQTSGEEQAQFRRLLDIEDPVLNEWLLLGNAPDDQTFGDIIRRVRAA